MTNEEYIARKLNDAVNHVSDSLGERTYQWEGLEEEQREAYTKLVKGMITTWPELVTLIPETV